MEFWGENHVQKAAVIMRSALDLRDCLAMMVRCQPKPFRGFFLKKTLVVATAFAFALAGFAATADAQLISVSFVSYGGAYAPPAVPAGDTLITNFSTDAGLSGTNYRLVTGDPRGGNGSDAPFFGPSVGPDPYQYLAVNAGGSATLSVPAVEQIQIYSGSLDYYNTISFSNGLSYTGAQLAKLSGAEDSPPDDKFDPSSNGLFYFSFSSDITSVTFATSQNSYEVAQVSGLLTGSEAAAKGLASGVPELSTWAMMALGFAGLAFAGVRRLGQRGGRLGESALGGSSR
jgi:hypothetical protein